MRIEIGGSYARAQSADAEALRLSRSADAEALRERQSGLRGDRALLLRPGNQAPSAPLLEALADHGLEPVVFRADVDLHARARAHVRVLPAPASLACAIVIGSAPYSEAGPSPWLATELEWLRRADAAGIAILGIGHGARALAWAFGGGTRLAERPQRGWSMVATSVPHRIAAGPWLTWQHDEIDLPPGAELLAYNRFGPQAFALGRHLAIHFHPEATPATVAGWAAQQGEDRHARAILGTTARDAAAARICAKRLFSMFIESV